MIWHAVLPKGAADSLNAPAGAHRRPLLSFALRGLNSVVAPGRTAGTEASTLEIRIFSDNNVFVASRFPCSHFEVGRFFVFLIPSSFVL